MYSELGQTKLVARSRTFSQRFLTFLEVSGQLFIVLGENYFKKYKKPRFIPEKPPKLPDISPRPSFSCLGI